jgi:hypothetical protein
MTDGEGMLGTMIGLGIGVLVVKKLTEGIRKEKIKKTKHSKNIISSETKLWS